MLKKKKIIEKLIEKLNSKIKESELFLKNNKIPEATDKKELLRMSQSDLEHGPSKIYSTEKNLFEYKKNLMLLQKLLDDSTETHEVCIGSVVTINGREKQIYIILPFCGGTKIETDDEVVMVASAHASFARNLLGRSQDGGYILEVA